ncbi:MAG: DUF1890 domain-containing protein [Methanomicrobiales archaeon]|nr:DUF1890 domain-containing protein [Methanomicrobiales archaeon]
MREPEKEEHHEALHLLGCPEVPVQTSIALYLMYLLRERGIRSTVAGTKAARSLVDLADPERHYVSGIMDLDEYIGMLAEGRLDYGHSFVYIHNDAGVSYAATVSALTKGQAYAIVFGSHAEERAAEITFKCRVIAAKVTHNPMPLKIKIEKALEEELHGLR